MKRVAVITGCSSGIGKAIAVLYSQKGYQLILTSRNNIDLDKFSDSIVDVITGDITDIQTIDKVENLIKQKYEYIDVLINNAGITYIQPFEENTPEQLDRIMATNLKAPILLTHRIYPYMKSQKSGHIVFINSSAGKEGYKNHTLYSSTKFGLSGFAKSLRLEAKQYGIRVTSIHPGGVKTNLYRNQKNPVDTSSYMEPEKIAEIVVYLTETSGFNPDEIVLTRMEKS